MSHTGLESATLCKSDCSLIISMGDSWTSYRLLNVLEMQSNARRQQEYLCQQKAFWKEAEAMLGPRSTWAGNEDGKPATVVFESK